MGKRDIIEKEERYVISLCLVVKNEEDSIGNFLESIKKYPIIDDVVIVDTGSSDNTVKMAEDAKYKVHCGKVFLIAINEDDRRRFPLQSTMNAGDALFHFAAARNYSISLAKNDWVLVSDTTSLIEIDEDGLRKDMAGPHDILAIYRIIDKGQEFMRPLLFKKYHKFVGMAHEAIVGERGYTKNLRMISLPESKPVCNGRYLRHLEYMYVNEKTPRSVFYLGREYYIAGDFKRAEYMLKEASEMALWTPEKSFCNILLGRITKQAEYFHKALEIDNTRREPWFETAKFHYDKKDYLGAVAYAKAGLEIPLRENYYFTDPELYTWKFHNILQIAYGRMGRKEDALPHWLICLKYLPDDKGLRSNLDYYFPKKDIYNKIDVEGDLKLCLS